MRQINPDTMRLGEHKVSSPPEICELFLRQLSSVLSNVTPDDDYVSRAIANVPLLPPVGPHPTITHDCVLKACNLLKKSSNPGPDGIPSISLRECASSLAAPLSTIFTTSINTGVFPTQWKKSFVFPIHKIGSKLEISNYLNYSN